MLSEIQMFQILGLLFFGSGLGLLSNPGFGRKLMDNLADLPVLMYFSSLVAIVFGYILVSFFNVWQWDWTLLITLVGWLTLIKGIFVLVFPGVALAWMKELKDSYVTIKALFSAVLGFVLLALSFFLA